MSADLNKEEQVWPEVSVYSEISGSGYALPEKVVANTHFESYLDTSDTWIKERTGIKERRWLGQSESINQLIVQASKGAIANAGLSVDDIDGIVVGTVSPDDVFPSAACRLQGELGIKSAFAFDLNAVCSGFVYALVTADSFVRSGQCENILVVGADAFSRLIDHNDRSTCILFGDGAGAVVLSRAGGVQTEKGVTPAIGSGQNLRGLYASELKSDGSQGDILMQSCGAGSAEKENGTSKLTMLGREVFKLAVRSLGDINEKVLAKAGLFPEQVDFFVSHQANKRILDAMAKQLSVPEEKVLMNVDRYGNTSAGTVPILLAEASEQGRIKKGDLLVLSAFGGGLTWGAVALRW